MVSGTLVVYQKPQSQPSSGNSGNSGNGSSTGNGGNGNTQTQTPPPAESQQPSSNDEGGATGTTDNPWGGVLQDSDQFDWSQDSDWVWQ